MAGSGAIIGWVCQGVQAGGVERGLERLFVGQAGVRGPRHAVDAGALRAQGLVVQDGSPPRDLARSAA
jgi:hypothetical protein